MYIKITCEFTKLQFSTIWYREWPPKNVTWWILINFNAPNFYFKSGYDGDISDTTRPCRYGREITDAIRPKVLTRVYLQMLWWEYHETFFGGHSVLQSINQNNIIPRTGKILCLKSQISLLVWCFFSVLLWNIALIWYVIKYPSTLFYKAFLKHWALDI